MRRSLAFVALGLLVFLAVAAQSTNEEIHLRSTVQDIVLLTSYSGTVIPVDVDPKFAEMLRIISVLPAITNLSVRSNVTFAIHSPSRLFRGDAPKGKTYDFSVKRKIAGGKVKYDDLELRKVQAKPPKDGKSRSPR